MNDTKKAVIISPFFRNSYNTRIKYLLGYFQELGYKTLVLTSDFDHREKQYIKIDKPYVKALHAKPYNKNLSIARINSHIDFSKKAINAVKKIDPDLLYVSGPPNYLYHEAAGYKKNNKECIVAFEIGDMWPETMPVSAKVKKALSPIFSLWARYRNASLKVADIVIYECDLFRNILEKYRLGKINETIYLCKKNTVYGELEYKNSGNELGIAYVGTINNIIDIDLIIEYLSKLNNKRKVRLEIIGNGEKKEELIKKAKENNIKVVDHGIVYNNKEKGKILSNCQFGLNIMKSSVMVGATMKSLEYFHWGLGLINNIKADTWEIIDEYKCGVNINKDSMNKAIKFLANISDENIKEIQKISRKVYLKYFDEKIIKKQYISIFS